MSTGDQKYSFNVTKNRVTFEGVVKDKPMMKLSYTPNYPYAVDFDNVNLGDVINDSFVVIQKDDRYIRCLSKIYADNVKFERGDRLEVFATDAKIYFSDGKLLFDATPVKVNTIFVEDCQPGDVILISNKPYVYYKTNHFISEDGSVTSYGSRTPLTVVGSKAMIKFERHNE